MTEYPRSKLYPYIIGIFAVASALGIWAVWIFPLEFDASHYGLTAALALLVALAGRFPFRVSPQGDATVSTAPIFLAVILLHPVEAALVAVGGTLIAEVLLKAHPEAVAFNTGSQGLAAIISGFMFRALTPESGIDFTLIVMLSAVLSGLALNLINHTLLFGMIIIVKGRGIWDRWWETYRFEATLDVGLLVVGLLGAQLITLNWWWLIVLVVPFVITYYGFRKSVENAVEKTELAQQLEHNLSELKETQSQLIQSAKLAGVGTLAAGLAHEINNPLTIITGRAELLIAKLRRNPETIVSDQTIKEIQNIHDMGIRISTIMKQLLTYSRRSEYLTDVQLNMVLDDAEQLLQTKIERKGIEIIKEYDHPPHIRGVANQLQQVFVNILGNAVDASPEQSRITMGYKTWDDVVVAFVKDEGSGMSKELQEHIFEPFFTTKGIGEGTGLGLYICHKIIEEHEGEIEISSREGEGTTFSIKLPLAVAHKDKSVTAA